MIILQSSLSIRVELFLKRKFWKKVHYYVSKVVFSFSPSIFHPFIRKMPSLDKRKFLFHYKETFSRMTEHTSLQKQIKQVFFRGITFRIYILETSKRRQQKKEKKSKSKITFLLKRHLHLLSILIKDSIIFYINPSRQNISLHAYTDSSPFYLIQTRYIGLTHKSQLLDSRCFFY